MQRLSLLACALLLAVVGFGAINLMTAKPAHAFLTANCIPNQLEVDDTVYYDSNLYKRASYLVHDTWDPAVPWHWVDIDLKTWHINYANFCWRAYYVSVWPEDGTGAYIRPEMRVWVCGYFVGYWDAGEIFTSNRHVDTQGPWNGVTDRISRSVQMWDGTWETLSFGAYGDAGRGTLCGPQADSNPSYAYTYTWYDPGILNSPMPNWYWYVNY